MIINLDGVRYRVPAEQEAQFIESWHQNGIQMYEAQGLELQLLATGLVRWILAKWERAVRKVHGQEAAAAIRPPKKKEPTVHLSELLAAHLREIVRDAELTVTTDGEGNTSTFALSLPVKDKARRPVVPHGNERIGQNNRAEVS